MSKRKSLLLAFFGVLASTGLSYGFVVYNPSSGIEENAFVQKTAFGASQAKALDALLTKKLSPKGFRFCAANKKTGECKGKRGLGGVGLGGALLPLALEVKSFDILDRSKTGDTWSLQTKFKARVNGIPPACAKTTGTILLSKSKAGELNYRSFYCNWLGIGNVVTKVKLKIDSVDLKGRSFAGSYSVRFNGTGNVFGAGRFRAFAR